MTDPTSWALVGVGSWYLKTLLEPTVKDLGELLRDQLNGYLGQNRRATLERGEAFVKHQGREPHAIPLRVLLPILDRCGFEDNEFLRDRWAALLASASTAAEQDEEVPPAFANILAQLTPDTARVLEVLADTQIEEGRFGITAGQLADKLALGDNARFTEQHVLFCLDLALGAGLVDREPALIVIEDEVRMTDGRDVQLSHLGRRFVRACRPPHPKREK